MPPAKKKGTKGKKGVTKKDDADLGQADAEPTPEQ
jgi:hypothetical protein